MAIFAYKGQDCKIGPGGGVVENCVLDSCDSFWQKSSWESLLWRNTTNLAKSESSVAVSSTHLRNDKYLINYAAGGIYAARGIIYPILIIP